MDNFFKNICMRKVENLRYCIEQLDRYYDIVAIERVPKGGRRVITGDEIVKIADKIAFYGESYLLNFNALLDTLARGFTRPRDRNERSGIIRKIFFYRWLPYQIIMNPGDSLLTGLKNEWDNWMGEVIKLRHEICHENSLRVMINKIFNLKWSKESKILDIKRHTINLNGREIEIYSYLKDVHEKLDDMLNDIVDSHLNREYDYPDQETRKRNWESQPDNR